METEMKNYRVYKWMRNWVECGGTALQIFALIYEHSANDGWFQGTAKEIADWIGVTRTTVMTNLKWLVEQKLIIKKKVILNNVEFAYYRVNIDF